MFMTSEARNFKEKAKLFMPPRTIVPSSLIELEIQIRNEWYCKNGSVKRFDIQNMEKILIDAIAEKYDFDDSIVWKKSAEKIRSFEQAVTVKIFRLKEDEQ